MLRPRRDAASFVHDDLGADERALGDGAEGIAFAAGRTVRPEATSTPPASVAPLDPDATGLWLSGAQARSSAPPAARGEPVSGPLRVVEEIGKGAMGVVYRALQPGLGREVAVKQSADAGPAASAQFLVEARLSGLLEHANIVPVYLLAEAEGGAPQLVMKLVRGQSLTSLLEAADPPPLERLLRILLSVCNALGYAHERGFIHRDLKLDNIMVGEFGQVFVLDWGIGVGTSRELCDAHGIPHALDVYGVAGTPSYLAPELARGDGARQDARTDVYLLGACLHAILTGRPRHVGSTLAAILASAIASEPYAYDASVPWELAEIANEATAAEPEDRYPSAAAFAEAIEGYLTHVSAHAIAREGLALVARIDEATRRYREAPPVAAEREELHRMIHRWHAESQFAFRHAQRTWSGARDAVAGAKRLADLMLDHALFTGDLGLAERLLEESTDPGLVERVALLRASLKARDEELVSLREHARARDWSLLGPRLGDVFIAGGLVLAAVLQATRWVLGHPPTHAFALNASMWLGSSLIVGGYAARRLRSAPGLGDVASAQVFGVWAAVGAGCLAVGLFNDLRPVPLQHDMIYVALLMSVGFVAMGLQTRRWLFGAAAAFCACAFGVARWPDHGFTLLSATWLGVMVGVGVALRRGFTLEASGVRR